jgi:DNA repair protein RadC
MLSSLPLFDYAKMKVVASFSARNAPKEFLLDRNILPFQTLSSKSKRKIMNARNQNEELKKVSTVHEVELVYKRPVLKGATRIRTSKEVETVLRKVYDKNRLDLKEFFYIILTSHYNQVVGVAQLSMGTVSNTIVSIAEIMQLALLRNASGIILSHNHPSGNLSPSQNDRILTKDVQKAAKLFNISVLDHIILTSEGYYSFSDHGEV